jgi:hypothetical protein
MLEVCLELGFPVSVLERSPLLLRDLDLLQEINERARAVMMWTIIYTPDSGHRATLRQLGQLAAGRLTPQGAVRAVWYQ